MTEVVTYTTNNVRKKKI